MKFVISRGEGDKALFWGLLIEATMSTKKINKNLDLGNKWTSYLLDEWKKVTDRAQINETATKFYAQLYLSLIHI